MKVFFDIGTNLFQGYKTLSERWGVTDDWHKVFVEPNAELHSNQTAMSFFDSIPNAILISSALCCDCPEDKAVMAIESGNYMDEGSNIFRNDWIAQGKKTVEVSVVDFDSICAPYKEAEWHMKFDCEGCEWSCLLAIIEKYHTNIKNLAVEFHARDPNDRFHPDLKDQITNAANAHGITIEPWY